ncbi:chorismate-binding protein [Runella slithyformis]|uniref:Chorismate binding domain-containing protein n=1 Tax=Runella slithyformis (strain ATCC 29530 / DSM 19594 / LMG 11500 / NCIMB 11436 / LSU 4) TaxID=761193 RepID=A0A7U3ZGK9_RUNSL|nr:chorismate-binding protein [Runella slithyformis]AEI46838.1 Chorismate binding domain-containing protein [Runella slithyformis DSM 19594]
MRQIVDSESHTTSQTVLPLHGWQSAYELGYAAALWRLPRQNDKHLILNFGADIPAAKMVLEDLPSGFAISPFLNLEDDRALFMEADVYFRFNEKDELIAESNHTTAETERLKEAWERHGKNVTLFSQNEPVSFDLLQTSSHERHLQSVKDAIAAIEAGKIQKVVLSRNKQVALPSSFSVTGIFERLCEKYPNAFVSLVYLPHLNQLWLGATPEILVSVDKQGIFRTVALAGTQSAFDASGQPIPPKQAPWTQKEIEEQALVSRYIISCFKKIRVREYLEEGPKTAVAGNLMHLRSDYAVDTKAINFPELGTVMLGLLHPTSAVCGMPKLPALQFIQQNEGYDREFYSGYLGPVNIDHETHLFVNLRCMKISNGVATLYGGGGITEDSIPEKEWQETELKCRTLLSVLEES